MSKKKKQNITYIIVIIGITLLSFVVMICIIFSKREKVIEYSSEPTIEYGSTSYVTPTILPSGNNKLIFHHPQQHFSFEYPKEWYLEVSKLDVNDNIYYVFLSEKKEYPSFRIYFMTGGREYPDYREEIEYKLLGGKNIVWTTLYDKENKALEAFTNFPDNDFDNRLINLYLYLPQENQQEFIKQVEEIIASLK